MPQFDTSPSASQLVIEIPWDTASRSWADYVGNQFYSSNAQIFMDICAGCLSDCRRLPTLREIRNLSKLSDRELRSAADNLAMMGWTDYAAIAKSIPANPKPHTPNRKQKTKEAIPTDLRWSVWERDNFTCLRCGRRTRLSVDHIHPESLGGPTEFENLQTLCVRCNSSKGSKFQNQPVKSWRSTDESL